MSRDELLSLVMAMHQRTEGELWTLILAQFDADAAALADMTAKRDALQAEKERDFGWIEWERAQAQKRIDENNALHAENLAGLRAYLTKTHEIGERVLDAHRARRKVVKVADMIADGGHQAPAMAPRSDADAQAAHGDTPNPARPSERQE